MRLLRPLRPVDKPGNPMTPPNPVTPGRNASKKVCEKPGIRYELSLLRFIRPYPLLFGP